MQTEKLKSVAYTYFRKKNPHEWKAGISFSNLVEKEHNTSPPSAAYMRR